eukprot:symbB.v1.2.038452.t1/scaffold5995.1/size23965/1
MVQQPGGGDGPSKGKSKSRSKSKGKSKGGKNGAKGKRPPQKGSAQARGKDALGRSICLRCGQAGHFARDCPKGGEKKRKAEDEDVNMVDDINNEEQPETNNEDTAVVDSGAVLGSRSRIYEYIKCLEKKGVNVDEDVEVFRCAKGFRYGNSQREVSKHCCLLPVFIGGKKIKVMCHLIEGEAPVLMSEDEGEDSSEDRERSLRRRNSEASTEVPVCPSPSDSGEPAVPEVHDPPDRGGGESPSKKARVDEPDEALAGGPPIIDDDELMIEDVHFVEKSVRKGEINTRQLTLEQREEVIAAKVKELKSFFTNQDPDLFNLDKASPTAARLGKLTLLSIAAIEGWQISCGDVRAAFLSGASFVRKLMVRLPKDCGPLLGIRSTEEVTMRMLKSAYGLADAPLLWLAWSFAVARSGEIPGGTGEAMQSLNKALRFSKENAKYGLQFHSAARRLEDVALLCFCDAAFGVRRDLSSQGGFMIVMTDKRVLHGEKCPFTPLAWKSFKLPRVCRSSLGAESQAMAGALEELLMIKTFLRMLLDNDMTLPRSQETLTMPCAVVTDCRALFDLLKKENIQTSNDKRVAIESLVIKDLLKQVNGELRWVSSERRSNDEDWNSTTAG